MKTIQTTRALRLTALMAAALALCGMSQTAQAAMNQPEALDTTALTDDHSINVPTSWWTYTNVTAAQVSSYLTAKRGGRAGSGGGTSSGLTAADATTPV